MSRKTFVTGVIVLGMTMPFFAYAQTEDPPASTPPRSIVVADVNFDHVSVDAGERDATVIYRITNSMGTADGVRIGFVLRGVTGGILDAEEIVRDLVFRQGESLTASATYRFPATRGTSSILYLEAYNSTGLNLAIARIADLPKSAGTEVCQLTDKTVSCGGTGKAVIAVRSHSAIGDIVKDSTHTLPIKLNVSDLIQGQKPGRYVLDVRVTNSMTEQHFFREVFMVGPVARIVAMTPTLKDGRLSLSYAMLLMGISTTSVPMLQVRVMGQDGASCGPAAESAAGEAGVFEMPVTCSSGEVVANVVINGEVVDTWRSSFALPVITQTGSPAAPSRTAGLIAIALAALIAIAIIVFLSKRKSHVVTPLVILLGAIGVLTFGAERAEAANAVFSGNVTFTVCEWEPPPPPTWIWDGVSASPDRMTTCQTGSIGYAPAYSTWVSVTYPNSVPANLPYSISIDSQAITASGQALCLAFLGDADTTCHPWEIATNVIKNLPYPAGQWLDPGPWRWNTLPAGYSGSKQNISTFGMGTEIGYHTGSGFGVINTTAAGAGNENISFLSSTNPGWSTSCSVGQGNCMTYPLVRGDISIPITNPVNCVGSWVDTGPCNVACGGGVLLQTYIVTTWESGGGAPCPSANGATQWGGTSCNVQACVTPPPIINSFTGSASVVSGNQPTLNWNVTGATSCTINQGVGAVNPPSIGSVLAPAIVAATTYTLSCVNGPSVPATAQWTVAVTAPTGVWCWVPPNVTAAAATCLDPSLDFAAANYAPLPANCPIGAFIYRCTDDQPGWDIRSTFECKAACGAATVPILSSPTAVSISSTGATLGANLVNTGGSPVTSRGTCWGLAANPVTNCTPEGGTGIGVFSHARGGLAPNTTYYYRGYATNGVGTGYSSDGTFTTPGAPIVNVNPGVQNVLSAGNWSLSMTASANAVYCEYERTGTYAGNFPYTALPGTSFNTGPNAWIGPGSVTYSFMCRDGGGTWSPPVSGTINISAPVAVASVVPNPDAAFSAYVGTTKLVFPAFTVRNIGDLGSNLSLQAVLPDTSMITPNSEYWCESGCTAFALAKDQEISVRIAFRPAAVGWRPPQEFTFVLNTGDVTRNAIGQGLDPFVPASRTFIKIPVASTSYSVLHLENNGDQPIDVGRLTGMLAPFDCTNDPGCPTPITIPPGGIDIPIKFTPTSAQYFVIHPTLFNFPFVPITIDGYGSPKVKYCDPATAGCIL